MENNNNILQELNGISPVLVQIPRVKVYTLPESYFSNVSVNVLTSITLNAYSKQVPYAIPQGYFLSFADVLLQKINALHNTAGTLPQQYFECLPDKILSRIKQEQNSIDDELNEIAPLLNNISKANLYTLPSGYFESLEVIVPRQTVPAKMIAMRKKFVQFAAAAGIAGAVVLGILMLNSNKNIDVPISYKEAVKMDIATNVSSLSDEEINTYLAETPVIGYAINNGAEINIEENIDAASDEEIEQFLQEQPDLSNEI